MHIVQSSEAPKSALRASDKRMAYQYIVANPGCTGMEIALALNFALVSVAGALKKFSCEGMVTKVRGNHEVFWGGGERLRRSDFNILSPTDEEHGFFDTVSDVCQGYARKAGDDKAVTKAVGAACGIPFSGNDLRRTFGRELYFPADVDIEIIRSYYNHASREMTERYIGADQKRMSEAIQKIPF